MNPILGRWHSDDGDALCLILGFVARDRLIVDAVVVTDGGVLRHVPLSDVRVERPNPDFPSGYTAFSVVSSGQEPLA